MIRNPTSSNTISNNQLRSVFRKPPENLLSITEKFCEPILPELDISRVLNPFSVPYNEEQHGNIPGEFRRHYNEFNRFRDKYHDLVDQLSILAISLNLAGPDLDKLIDNLDEFKGKLFIPGYVHPDPEILWNMVREHLEVVVMLLRQPGIPEEQRLDVIKNLGGELQYCPTGIVSYLQQAIQTLASEGDVIPRMKDILVRQLAIEFIREKNFCPDIMEVHYVNAFINYLANDLGLNKCSHEKGVTPDHFLVRQNMPAFRQILTEKLPIILVSSLTDELRLAGCQALREGRFEGESWQHFSNSSIATFFNSGFIQHTLFVEDEQSGRFDVLKDSHPLERLVARYLIDQEWLQPQENWHLMDDDDGGELYTLSNYWFWWQSKEDSEDQRSLTAKELLKLFAQVTQLQTDQAPCLLTSKELNELFAQATQLQTNQALCLLTAKELHELFAQVTQLQTDQAPQLIRLALRLLELAMNQESPKANRYYLGEMYEKGQGVARDAQEACRFYQLAADQGHAWAQFNLGRMYEYGQGMAEDKEKAYQLYQLAANQGHARAQYHLGGMYEKGQGVEWSDEKACELYQAAANQGHAWAQFKLGEMYAHGQGVEWSDEKACQLYQSAVEQGHAWAQFNLGEMYEKGQGVERSNEKACELYQAAANQGHAWAQFNLGEMYEKGQGVERSNEKACELYQAAANQGHAWAQYHLGGMYEKGQGVERSEEKACELYRLAADQGHAWAQFNLGRMYEYGQGMAEDKEKAYQLYQLAADQQHAQAQFKIEGMTKNGVAVNKSQQGIEEIFSNQITAPYHAALAEAVASFNKQQQPFQGVTTEQGGVNQHCQSASNFDPLSVLKIDQAFRDFSGGF
ncbi:SEL1-like repeat protein [unidentified bacterial endosymbiont]|uniref:SEL1-like repeat protein n=1 Tax=unidentified bacterial endosymbiont TaxID=2355 RepID=UPI00209F0751|nr:SEL1-like repeat protein [unidentified bacterial endosymbiont]